MRSQDPPGPEAPAVTIVDGRRVVTYAPTRATFDLDEANALLVRFGGSPIDELPDGTLALDSDGTCRYRRVGQDRWNRRFGIYALVVT